MPATCAMRSRLRSTSCTPTMSGLAARMASPIWLAKAQREAVALADREALVAVDVSPLQGRRQRPDAIRVVGRVLRVGVDFALAYQPEAGFLDQRDRVILAHVTGLRFRVLR